MKPEEAEAELSAWLDGELTEGRAREVEAVVAGDARLSALVQRLRSSRELMASLASPEPTARLRANVLSAIAAPEPTQRWFTWPRLSLGFAAAVAVLAAVWWARPVAFGGDEEKLLVAQNLELLEDYEVLSLRDAEDLEVIAAMKELEEAQP